MTVIGVIDPQGSCPDFLIHVSWVDATGKPWEQDLAASSLQLNRIASWSRAEIEAVIAEWIANNSTVADELGPKYSLREKYINGEIDAKTTD